MHRDRLECSSRHGRVIEVHGECRLEDDELIARIDKTQNERVKGAIGAGSHQDLFQGINVTLQFRSVNASDGIDECRMAKRAAILVVASVDSLN